MTHRCAKLGYSLRATSVLCLSLACANRSLSAADCKSVWIWLAPDHAGRRREASVELKSAHAHDNRPIIQLAARGPPRSRRARPVSYATGYATRRRNRPNGVSDGRGSYENCVEPH